MKEINKKISEAVRRGEEDPLKCLTPEELKQYAAHTRRTATNAKKRERDSRKKAVEGLEAAIRSAIAPHLSTLPKPSGFKVYLSKMGEVEVKFSRRIQPHKKPAQPLNAAALAYAMFLRQLGYDTLKKRRVPLEPILDAMREELEYDWPGEDDVAKRDSLKNAMARAGEEVTMVVTERDIKAIRKWGAGDLMREQAAAAMVEALRSGFWEQEAEK